MFWGYHHLRKQPYRCDQKQSFLRGLEVRWIAQMLQAPQTWYNLWLVNLPGVPYRTSYPSPEIRPYSGLIKPLVSLNETLLSLFCLGGYVRGWQVGQPWEGLGVLVSNMFSLNVYPEDMMRFDSYVSSTRVDPRFVSPQVNFSHVWRASHIPEQTWN